MLVTLDLDVEERLKKLNLHSLQRRRERYIIIHVWKILNQVSPNDLLLEFIECPRFGIKAKVPPLKSCSLAKPKTLYEHSFAVQGPRLWNIVPKKLKAVKHLNDFKEKLSGFLLSFPDKPPVKGYTRENRNSLIDWHQQSGGQQNARRPW